MTYNKETVVGVIEQIIEVKEKMKQSTETELGWLLRQAINGAYSTPTLEEVWREKTKGATLPMGIDFVFEYENETYITRCSSGCHWEKPRKVIKL
jgi:hypothetical protein